MKSRLIFTFGLFLSVALCCGAQAQMTWENYKEAVLQCNPQLKNYQLETEKAQTEIMRAKSLLDPVFSAKLGEKTLDGKTYYRQRGAEITLPTLWGVDLTGSLSEMTGDRLNNSDTRGGLFQLGVQVPLLQGLLYNKRRAELQKAEIYLEIKKNEWIIYKNNLLLDAAKAYLNYSKNYQLLQINLTAYKNNAERYSMIRQSIELGERPAIDSAEAKTQIQYYLMRAEEQNTMLHNNFAVLQQYAPCAEGLLPVPNESVSQLTEKWLNPYLLAPADSLISNNPYTKYYAYKDELLSIQQRLNRQMLLPIADFKYNFLSKTSKDFRPLPLFEDNYQYSVKLEIPLFMRAARAGIEYTKIEEAQNQNDRLAKVLEMQTKYAQYRNDYQLYQKNTETVTELVRLNQQLLEGEKILFANGEGSLFLINTRENKLIDIQEKSVETQTKLAESLLKLRWSLAMMDE